MKVIHDEGEGAKYAPDAYIVPEHGVVLYSSAKGLAAIPLSETDIDPDDYTGGQ